MRQIEKDMLGAIKSGKNWRSDNTEVTHSHTLKGGTETEVRLHGHLIAKRYSHGQWEISLAGWNTPTTRSRLSAIVREFHPSYCRGVSTKQGQAFVNYVSHNKMITNNEWVIV